MIVRPCATWLAWAGIALGGCAQRPSADAPSNASSSAERRDSVSAARGAGTPASVSAGGVLAPQIAGSWYPDERFWLIAEAERLLRAARTAPSLSAKPIALVVPHAGWRYSGAAAAAAFRTLHRGDFSRVVLLGPAHESGFEGFALTDVAAVSTPLGDVPVCPAAGELRDGTLVRSVPGAYRGEHSLEIELPFLQETLGAFCVVPILVGQTTPEAERALAGKLAPLADGTTLFVVSSDFVHYGSRFDYTPFGASAARARDRIFALENRAVERLQAKDAAGFRQLIASTGATICGRKGQQVLLELLPKIAPDARAIVLAHYSSTDLHEADDDSSVGYVAVAFVKGQPGSAERDAASPLGAPARTRPCESNAPPLEAPLGKQLVGVARAALATALGAGNELGAKLAALPPTPALDCEQAVFVTLKESGKLRGCVGQPHPEHVLPEAVVRSAIDAGLHDDRFDPVTAQELGRLSFELTVLSVPAPVGSARDIVVGKHGVILSEGGRRALFLPQVATEQGWTREQMLAALSEKAGLSRDAWREADARFSVFTGQVFEER